MFISAAAAAAIIFTGAGASQADAANCETVKQVTYKSINQEEVQKVLEQYLAKYNIVLPASQLTFNTLKQQVQATPEAQPEATEEVATPEVQPEATEEVATPEVQPEATPEVQPEATEEVATPEAQPEATEEVATPEAQPEATEEVATDKTNDAQKETSSELSAFEKEVVTLTNAERAKQGLSALEIDTELSKVARVKSQDMKDNNYFDHNSPTYGSPFDMMKQFGISYTSAGENIAQGQQTPEEVVEAWMNSQGHRENIMNSSFTHIGVGYVESGNYWTQQFIGK
ncbi:CAP domain-containing protein [Peribacillus sp. NPDC097295]|uniref:CAP domain-containing protein n=1 Tax=Peribacillus sp. NPDC097295 TaxID=3364402 RepID=UPI003812ABB7